MLAQGHQLAEDRNSVEQERQRHVDLRQGRDTGRAHGGGRRSRFLGRLGVARSCGPVLRAARRVTVTCRSRNGTATACCRSTSKAQKEDGSPEDAGDKDRHHLLQETHATKPDVLIIPGYSLAAHTTSGVHGIATFVLNSAKWHDVASSAHDDEIE